MTEKYVISQVERDLQDEEHLNYTSMRDKILSRCSLRLFYASPNTRSAQNLSHKKSNACHKLESHMIRFRTTGTIDETETEFKQ